MENVIVLWILKVNRHFVLTIDFYLTNAVSIGQRSTSNNF